MIRSGVGSPKRCGQNDARGWPMNVQARATVFPNHQHHAPWAPAIMSEPATNRRPLSSVESDRRPDTPVGISSAWRDVIQRATRVAATEATTCLQGESGTGKEVIARF